MRLAIIPSVGQVLNDVILTSEQAKTLREGLRRMRHDVNNHLSVVVASVELIRARPEMAQRMLDSLSLKPGHINDAIRTFSEEFEKLLPRDR